MTWRPHLTPDERARIVLIKADIAQLRREYRTLYDRARKRAERSTTRSVEA